MTSIGETLRRERTRRGLDLKSVSSELKISLRYLEAIEAEAFDKLPGGMFTKSFVRQYARYLGLDEDDLVSELDKVIEPAAPAPARTPSEIEVPRVQEWQVMNDRFSWSSSLPALAMVVVVMLVCSFVYSWWQRSRSPANAAAQQPAATEVAQAQPKQPAAEPAQPATPAPAPAEPAAQPQTPPAIPPAATSPATSAAKPATEQAPQRVRQDVGSADRPAPEGATPAATPATPGAVNPSATVPPGGGPVHVELTATEPVWVLAQTDGKYSFSGTIEANQTRTVEATGKVVLRLGNAGGVTITLNGKPIGTVGAKGQVKTIQLTSGGWTAAAPKPSLPVEDIL